MAMDPETFRRYGRQIYGHEVWIGKIGRVHGGPQVIPDDAVRPGMKVILVICHDLNITSRFADRLILLSKGVIGADSKAAEVITEENIRNVYGMDTDVTEVSGRPYIIYHADENNDPGLDR